MEHMQIMNAIQTQDIPALLGILESKYGKKWMEKNFAFMGILNEEGASGMFRTMGNGSNANLMKIGHAVIRSLAYMIHEQDPKISELDAAKSVISTIWLHINGDMGRAGVPDTIFKAVMEKEAEQDASSQDTPHTHEQI